MMLGFQSRNKRSLNNYYAIEIMSRGSILQVQQYHLGSEFNMKIEPEKCSIFLISVGRLFSYEKKLLLCLVAFNYKHDGYGNPGKSCHLYINCLPCHPSLIIGSNNDLCEDNYAAG